MSLPKKGKPIPKDLAREYLTTIAAGLRAEAKSGRHTPSFFYPPLSGGYHVAAFELAADVLERVAAGADGFGDLIRAKGKAAALHYKEAVQEVYSQAVRADLQGEPITREEAFERADEALGRNNCKRLYLEWEKRFGRWEFPTTNKRQARTKG